MDKNLIGKIFELANEIKVENDLFDYVASIQETANAIWYRLEIVQRIEIIEHANASNRKLALSNCIKLISNVLTSENSNA